MGNGDSVSSKQKLIIIIDIKKKRYESKITTKRMNWSVGITNNSKKIAKKIKLLELMAMRKLIHLKNILLTIESMLFGVFI